MYEENNIATSRSAISLAFMGIQMEKAMNATVEREASKPQAYLYTG
jgi:hypothetical protein